MEKKTPDNQEISGRLSFQSGKKEMTSSNGKSPKGDAKLQKEIPKKGGPKRKKTIITMVIIAALVVAALIVFFVMRNKSKQAETASAQVQTTPLVKSDLQETIDASGTVASASTTYIYAPQSLTVDSISVKLGDIVTAGQTLTQLDTTTVEQEIATQELNIKSAEANLSSSEQSAANSQRSAAASLRSAKTDLQLAEESYERQKAKVTAQQGLDQKVLANNPTVEADTTNQLVEVVQEETSADSTLSESEQSALDSSVRQAKLELEAAENTYSDLLADQGNVTAVKQAQLELEAAQLTYDNAQSGYSTENSVASAQLDLQVAQNNLQEVSLQQNNKVTTADLDLRSAENNYTNASNAYYAASDVIETTDPTTGAVTTSVNENKQKLYETMQSAAISLEKQKVSYNDTMLSRDSAMASAQEQVTKAQLSVDNVGKDTENTKTNAEEALTKAKLNYDNAVSNSSESLQSAAEAVEKAKISYQSALTSQSESLDSAKSSLVKAESSYQSALINTQSSTSTASSQISIEQQQLQLQTLQDTLADTTVRSPVGGTVTYVNVEDGATASGLIFVVEDTDDLIVNTTVGESDINSLSVGQSVQIQTDNTGDDVFKGTIIQISNAATKDSTGATSSSTNVTFDVVISITDKDSRLKIGMNATLSIVVNEATNVYAVETDLVTTRGDKSFIEVKEGEGTKQIEVTTGLETDTMTEISSPELKEGLEIVSGTAAAATDVSTSTDEQMPGGMDGGMGGMTGGGGGGGGGGGMGGGMGGGPPGQA